MCVGVWMKYGQEVISNAKHGTNAITNCVDTVRSWLLLLTHTQLHTHMHTNIWLYQVHLYSTKWLLIMACQLPEGELSELNIHSIAKRCLQSMYCISYVCTSCTGYRQIGYSRLVLLIQQLNLAGGTHCMSSSAPNTGIHYKWMQSMNMYDNPTLWYVFNLCSLTKHLQAARYIYRLCNIYSFACQSADTCSINLQNNNVHFHWKARWTLAWCTNGDRMNLCGVYVCTYVMAFSSNPSIKLKC